MNFSEIGLKDLVLDFDSNDLQDITIVQGDTKTRGFKVLVSTNNGEIIKASSQYEMRLYGINSNYPDKSFFTKGVIDGDFYKVYISTDMASKSGKLQLQLALFEGTNALIQSRIKEVDVYRSIANGGNVGKDLVVDFGKLNNALEIAEKQQKKFEESLVRQEAVESQIAEKHTEVVQIRDGLKDVLSTENARVEAEKKRVSAESTRASQEKTRQSNEKTRISNETTRKQSEDTRASQEKTRQSQEQSRVDAESKRETSEATREKSEQTRNTKESERQKAEQERATQEDTRKKQENSRVEAEKQRAKAESDRAGKFAGWDKTMSGVIPTATSTVAGIVRIDVDGESTAASVKTLEEVADGLSRVFEEALNTKANKEHTHTTDDITDLETVLSTKASKEDIDKLSTELTEKVDNFKVEAATSKTAGIVKIDVDGEDTAVSKKTYEEDIKKIVKNFDGRNYLLNSNISVTNADYPMVSYKLSEKPIVGETYTCTIWGKLGDGKEGFKIYNSGGTITLANGEYLRKLKEGLYQISFKWVNKTKYGVADDSELTIYPEDRSAKVESTINKIKLEKGTNCTPATEDLIISDVVTNITVIQSGASTDNITPGTLIFEV